MLDPITTGVFVNVLSGSAGFLLSRLVQVMGLDQRLAGRWDGDLAPQGNAKAEFGTHEIKWSMVLARPMSGQLRGLLYYSRECTATNTVIAQGVDELRDYRRGSGLLAPSKCTMEFTRRFHKMQRGRTDYSPRLYTVNCTFASNSFLGTSRKIYIEMFIVNGSTRDQWTGLLHKA